MKYQYKLQPRVIEFIENLIKDHKDLFSEETFYSWYRDNNIEFKSNPDTYVLKVFERELLNGKFKPIVKIPNCEPMFKDMRERGVKVIEEDTLYISIMEKHLVNEGQLTRDELMELNHLAVDYIIQKYEQPNTGHFIEVFKKSKRHFNFEGTDDEYEHISQGYQVL